MWNMVLNMDSTYRVNNPMDWYNNLTCVRNNYVSFVSSYTTEMRDEMQTYEVAPDSFVKGSVSTFPITVRTPKQLEPIQIESTYHRVHSTENITVVVEPNDFPAMRDAKVEVNLNINSTTAFVDTYGSFDFDLSQVLDAVATVGSARIIRSPYALTIVQTFVGIFKPWAKNAFKVKCAWSLAHTSAPNDQYDGLDTHFSCSFTGLYVDSLFKRIG